MAGRGGWREMGVPVVAWEAEVAALSWVAVERFDGIVEAGVIGTAVLGPAVVVRWASRRRRVSREPRALVVGLLVAHAAALALAAREAAPFALFVALAGAGSLLVAWRRVPTGAPGRAAVRRAVGPVAAGAVMATAGTAWAFALVAAAHAVPAEREPGGGARKEARAAAPPGGGPRPSPALVAGLVVAAGLLVAPVAHLLSPYALGELGVTVAPYGALRGAIGVGAFAVTVLAGGRFLGPGLLGHPVGALAASAAAITVVGLVDHVLLGMVGTAVLGAGTAGLALAAGPLTARWPVDGATLILGAASVGALAQGGVAEAVGLRPVLLADAALAALLASAWLVSGARARR